VKNKSTTRFSTGVIHTYRPQSE